MNSKGSKILLTYNFNRTYIYFLCTFDNPIFLTSSAIIILKKRFSTSCQRRLELHFHVFKISYIEKSGAVLGPFFMSGKEPFLLGAIYSVWSAEMRNNKK